MSQVKQNYDIYDKELLAIVLAFWDRRLYFERLPYRIRIILYHKNLEQVLTTNNSIKSRLSS